MNSNSNVVNFRKILWPAGTVISQVQLEMVPDLAVLITPFTSSIFCSHGAKFVSVMNEKNEKKKKGEEKGRKRKEKERKKKNSRSIDYNITYTVMITTGNLQFTFSRTGHKTKQHYKNSTHCEWHLRHCISTITKANSQGDTEILKIKVFTFSSMR